jgi:hypothetical protein
VKLGQRPAHRRNCCQAGEICLGQEDRSDQYPISLPELQPVTGALPRTLQRGAPTLSPSNRSVIAPFRALALSPFLSFFLSRSLCHYFFSCFFSIASRALSLSLSLSPSLSLSSLFLPPHLYIYIICPSAVNYSRSNAPPTRLRARKCSSQYTTKLTGGRTRCVPNAMRTT